MRRHVSHLDSLVRRSVDNVTLVGVCTRRSGRHRTFQQLGRSLLDTGLALTHAHGALFPLLNNLTDVDLLIVLTAKTKSVTHNIVAINSFITLLLCMRQLIFPATLLKFAVATCRQNRIDVSQMRTVLRTRPGIRSRPPLSPLPVARMRKQLRTRGLDCDCPNDSAPTLSQIDFSVTPKRQVSVINPVNSNGSALTGTLPHLLRLRPKRLGLSHHSILRIPLRSLQQTVTCIPRSDFLFDADVRGGVHCNIPLARFNRIRCTTGRTRVSTRVRGFPRRCSAVINRQNVALSNKRHRQATLTHTLIMSTPVLILSSTLSDISGHATATVLGTLSRKAQRGAILFVSRRVSTTTATSQVFIVSRNHVIRVNARDRLLTRNNLCHRL